MKIEYKKLDSPDDCILIDISGKIGATELVSMAENLQEALALNTGRILLDLKGLEFINSMGIGKIVLLHKACVQRKGKMVISGVQPKVMKLFQILCLDSVLTIKENIDQALESF
jgi:anti-anti-sigma factor